MIAVGRPIANSIVVRFAAHNDDRVEKAAKLGYDGFELADVRVGKIALVRRWFDLLDQQRSQNQPVAAKRFAIRADHFSAVPIDDALQIFDGGGSWACKLLRGKSG